MVGDIFTQLPIPSTSHHKKASYGPDTAQFLEEMIGVSRKFMFVKIAHHHILMIFLWKTRMLKFFHLIIRTLTQQYSMNQNHHHQFAQQCLGEARGLLSKLCLFTR